jgi:hypothetical protein
MPIQSSFHTDVSAVKAEIFPLLGLADSIPGVFSGEWFGSGTYLEKRSPIDGTFLARIARATSEDYQRAVAEAQRAFLTWRVIPAPQRGEVVRRLGNRLRELKIPLARLVSLEVGKILAEGEGEVQEMIDISDFANGLSRQLYGLTIASERSHHRMLEQWHPLGLVGVISAFNFPVAPALRSLSKFVANPVSTLHFGVWWSAVRRSAVGWRKIRESRWSPRLVQPEWGERFRSRWRTGWAARFWNSGGITP